jgi:hypothetical protein
VAIDVLTLQAAFAVKDPLPVGQTEAHGSAAAAAAAVAAHGGDAPQDDEIAYGGAELVEAVFRGLFPNAFQSILPVRNHKVPCFPWMHPPQFLLRL